MRLNSILKIWCLSLICCGVLACESLPSGRSSPEKTTAFKLPPIPVPRDSVEVDIVFIDRPASDPMLGKTLWREVDQVGALTTEQRAAIRAAGIQVGHVGSSPPDVLQSLLNLASDESERKRREANGIPQTSARRIILPAGSDTEINASEPIPSRDIDFPDGRHLELLEVHGNLRLRSGVRKVGRGSISCRNFITVKRKRDRSPLKPAGHFGPLRKFCRCLLNASQRRSMWVKCSSSPLTATDRAHWDKRCFSSKTQPVLSSASSSCDSRTCVKSLRFECDKIERP